MALMILFLCFTTCIVGNHATSFDSPTILLRMMSRLEMLEKKSEKYDMLLLENEQLKKRIEVNEARISELTTKVRFLEGLKGDTREKEFQKLSTRFNESQSSNEFVRNEKMLEMMTMTESKTHENTMVSQRYDGIIKKRIVNPAPDKIAFHAQMSTNSLPNLPTYHILRFDKVIVNIGEGYHGDDGVFTVPQTGVYVFSWSVAVQTGGWVSVEILVDGVVVGSSYVHGPSGWDFSSSCVVVQAKAYGHMFIRMHQTGSGVVLSESRGRSSFSGWLLF